MMQTSISSNPPNSLVLSVALALALAPALAVAAAARIGAGQGGSRRSLLRERGGEDLRGQVEDVAEVVDALVRQEVVVPLPIELLRDVRPGAQRTQHHHHVQVRDVLELVVPARARILLHAHHALLEEVLQDLAALLLRYEDHGVVGGGALDAPGDLSRNSLSQNGYGSTSSRRA